MFNLFSDLGDSVLGLFSKIHLDSELVTKIMELISQRNESRIAKDWKKSDSIRDELMAIGVEIQDTSEGTTWKLI